jgi:hypothetical protein
MTVQDSDRHQRQRALAPLPDDDQVLTFLEWCDVNAISKRTGQRILQSKDGPTVTMLSARRIGITRRADRVWKASRARA